jgi:hypothetical protein
MEQFVAQRPHNTLRLRALPCGTVARYDVSGTRSPSSWPRSAIIT